MLARRPNRPPAALPPRRRSYPQIAKAQGAHVTTTCSGANAALVKGLGADQAVDYTQERWGRGWGGGGGWGLGDGLEGWGLGPLGADTAVDYTQEW
jgi:hypothetical protein